MSVASGRLPLQEIPPYVAPEKKHRKKSPARSPERCRPLCLVHAVHYIYCHHPGRMLCAANPKSNNYRRSDPLFKTQGWAIMDFFAGKTTRTRAAEHCFGVREGSV